MAQFIHKEQCQDQKAVKLQDMEMVRNHKMIKIAI